jgi:hypothetical protein
LRSFPFQVAPRLPFFAPAPFAAIDSLLPPAVFLCVLLYVDTAKNRAIQAAFRQITTDWCRATMIPKHPTEIRRIAVHK